MRVTKAALQLSTIRPGGVPHFSRSLREVGLFAAWRMFPRRVGHISAESITRALPLNADIKELGVRHFSRFSRSGPSAPPARNQTALLRGWHSPIVRRYHLHEALNTPHARRNTCQIPSDLHTLST